MRILDRYLYKELFSTFFAVLFVLLLIVFGGQAAKLLTGAVEGSIHASIVLELLLLQLPATLEVIFPLVALLSVMLAMGRLYQDHEMEVLHSCGIPQGYFQKRLILFLIPLALFTAFLTLFLTPWSYDKIRHIEKEAQETSPLAALIPGKFNMLPDNKGILYAQSIDSDHTMKKVWLKLKQSDNDVMLIAPSGRFEMVNGRLALVLIDGKSYEGVERGESLGIRNFERFEAFLPNLEVSLGNQHRFAIATSALMDDPTPQNQSLLQWRIVLPMSVLVMGLLALKMSKTKPRQGRYSKIFLALILYVLYYQLMISGRENIRAGHLDPSIGMWPIPIVFLLFSLLRFEDLKAFFSRKKSRE